MTNLYFSFKTFFEYILPLGVLALCILYFIGLYLYAQISWIFSGKAKQQYMLDAGYAHELFSVSGCRGDVCTYHWVKHEPRYSSLKDDTYWKMNKKSVREWLRAEQEKDNEVIHENTENQS